MIAGWKGLVEASTYAEAKRVGRIASDRGRAQGLVTAALVAGARARAARAGDGASRDAGSWPRNDGDEGWELPLEEHRLG